MTITSAAVIQAGTSAAQFSVPAPARDVQGTIGPSTTKFKLSLPTQA